MLTKGAHEAGTTPEDIVRSAVSGSRQFIEALGVAVYMTDAQGVITEYNEAAVELWGRRPEIGRDLWCGSWRLYYTDGTAMAHDACPMAITLAENRPVRGVEAIAERPDGSRLRFQPYPTPLHDAAGNLVGAVNVLVDITSLRSTEQALHEKSERLTEALAAKDEFLGLISHELRTPITTILGNAEIMQRLPETLPAEARRQAAGDILNEARRLERIVDDLLTLARLGRDRIEPEPIAMTSAVAAIVTEHKRISSRPVSVQGEPVLALGDGNLAGHVVRNFLGNADKYSAGGVPIEIMVEGDSREVRVRVMDRGIGIDADEASRLFEPFFRGRNVGRTPGMGIGLSVCQRLIEASGGRVWATARGDGGSEFGFALPAYSVPDEPEA